MKNDISAREEILSRLKTAGEKAIPSRPNVPALNELSLTGEELIAKFVEEVNGQTGVVHHVPDKAGALATLTEIVQAEGYRTVMASREDVLFDLDLPCWGRNNGVEIFTSRDFNDRDHFIKAVFDEAQAGITGADFAVAESGTIGLVHDKDRPRLISLAPIHHIAILALERLVPVYENITDILFTKKDAAPGHVTLITGPSMTADIQATPFKGMHGPRKLDVIILG